jgi:hypothetical protein
VLPLLAAAAWPPPGLSSAQADAVERGEVVFTGRAEDGGARTVLAVGFHTDASTVWAATKDFCADPAPKNQKLRRFYEPAHVEPLLSDAFKPELLDGVPRRRCEDMAGRDRLYLYMEMKGPAIFPDMWALIQMRRASHADGSYSIDTEAVAGSMKEMHTVIRVLPISATRSAFYETSRFHMGLPLPDFVLEQMLKTRRRQRVDERMANLRRRVMLRQRKSEPPAAPPATLQNSQPPSSSAPRANGR